VAGQAWRFTLILTLLRTSRKLIELIDMGDLSYQLGVYLHLAQASRRRRRPLVRDRMLLLAGVVAANMRLDPVAAYCRQTILQHNPQHLVGRWTSLTEALADEEFLAFLKQVRRKYPPEKAERMLASLGLEMARERDAYYSDLEYAAAILGVTPHELQQSRAPRDDGL
jgi:hypothetical protein